MTPPVTTTNSPSVTVTIPPTVTGANRKAAEAGVTAWRNAMHTFDLSLQDPTGKNWKTAIYRYMGDPAAAEQILRIQTFASHKIHQVGFTRYSATVTKATTKNVQIRACVDVSAMDVVNADGESELKPGGAKRFYRDFSVTWYTAKKGGWLLNDITTPDPTQPC